ncbi:MAG TPA: hypothetical protein VLR70_16325 [Arthrobacter sp.]|nr:hypothetical protein [Arthrobacter sp.]
MNNESAAARMSRPGLCTNVVITRQNSRADTPEAEGAAVGSLPGKKGGDGSWTIGTANTEQKDIAETTGLDAAALPDQIRAIRQDAL